MASAARDETLSAPMMGSGEEVFFLGARGKKSHQGIFPRNRAIAVGSTWVKSQNPDRAIPLPQIADRAEELDRLLQET
jgi:hypothetical protein